MHAGRLVVVGIAVAAAAALYGGYALRRSNAPPSMVLVTIDTLRADRLGAYGRVPSITPALDALAARGVVFENAWTTAPLTVPAHASFLTGLLPPKHGLRFNQPAPLPPRKDRGFFTLAEVLKDKGYATGAFVSASVLRGDDTGLDAGFDVYDEVPRAAPGAAHDRERPGRGEETVQRALAWAASADGPVLLWVHLFDPHGPYDAPGTWGAGPTHTADAQGYDAEVAYVDHCVGRLLEGLSETGRADAVIAVVADHGEALGEHGEPTHGYLLHEATLRVPLVFATPGLRAGRRPEPVSGVDVFPTLLALAGHPLPSQVNGRPLFETSRVPTDPSSRPIYAETLYAWDTCRWAQCFALRRGDEKIVSAGAEVTVFDLSKDSAEVHPRPADTSQAEDVAQLLRVAREASLGSVAAPGAGGPSGSYWSSGAASSAQILPDEENAKLPSPYDRMDVLRQLDTARTLLSAGRADEALAAFDAIAAKDPGNVQCEYWRARCFEARQEWTNAAQAYRRAFQLGMRARASVAKALHCSWKAGQGSERTEPDPTESDRAITFLSEVRAQAVPDDAATYLMEAMLRIDRGEYPLADEALRRARTAPGIDTVLDRVEKARELLDALRKQHESPR